MGLAAELAPRSSDAVHISKRARVARHLQDPESFDHCGRDLPSVVADAEDLSAHVVRPRSLSSTRMKVEFSEDGRDFSARDWVTLVEADPSGTFFQTPRYLKLYWEEFGETPE